MSNYRMSFTAVKRLTEELGNDTEKHQKNVETVDAYNIYKLHLVRNLATEAC